MPCQVVGKKTFRFKNKLISMDSTTIDLCLESLIGPSLGGPKEPSSFIFFWITMATSFLCPHHRRKCLRCQGGSSVSFRPGTIVVDDRGYNDYALFGRWTTQSVYFVTRMKDNALYEVVGEKEVPRNRNVLKDEMVELRGPKAIEKCPYPLRRIEVYDPETEEVLVFLTNNFNWERPPLPPSIKSVGRLRFL